MGAIGEEIFLTICQNIYLLIETKTREWERDKFQMIENLHKCSMQKKYSMYTQKHGTINENIGK